MAQRSPMGKLVLMDEHAFVVSDEVGDLGRDDPADGLYFRDTRYLSHYRLTLNGTPLSLLAAAPAESTTAAVHLTNAHFETEDGTPVLPQTISVRRLRSLAGGLRDELDLTNYNRFPVPFRLEVSIGADFRDMFDVRGIAHAEPGETDAPVVRADEIALRYRGRDGVDRLMRLRASPGFTGFTRAHRRGDAALEQPVSLPDATRQAEHHRVHLHQIDAVIAGVLEPQRPFHATISVEMIEEGSSGHRHRRGELKLARIQTSSDAVNRLIERGLADLAMLTWWPRTGPVPVAGIPWFACPFGRDSLIAALQTLMVGPELAAGTLRFLAAHQATRVDEWRDAEPGKIMHELRFGELARLGRIPQSPYYGSADATPLFLILLGRAIEWLDDDALLDELWPNAEAALGWMDRYGDLDGDGLIEYLRRCPIGIENQGWKDSPDSATHASGARAEPPVALIEVQAYAYAARRAMAALCHRRGDAARADRLEAEAEQLRQRVHERFWLPHLGLYAEALDRDKRPIEVATSNAVHTLWCGLPDAQTAASMAARLAEPDMLCGWGLRTLSSQARSFNPMSYHNGSVWPHDNAIAAAGLLRYGHEVGLTIVQQVFAAGQGFRALRLPELYCGFSRDEAQRAPAAYPVSCSPQAWAAGAPLMMLQAMLGVEPAGRRRLRINPNLPVWLGWVELVGMRLGGELVNLRVERRDGTYAVDVDGRIEIVQGLGEPCGSPS